MPVGYGRFIADSWFSDEPLPAAYTAPAALRVRETGGVGGKDIDKAAVEHICARSTCRPRLPAFATRLRCWTARAAIT